MGYEVVLSRTAADDLAEIVEYIARDNPRAALTFGHELVAHTRKLKDFPQIGRGRFVSMSIWLAIDAGLAHKLRRYANSFTEHIASFIRSTTRKKGLRSRDSGTPQEELPRSRAKPSAILSALARAPWPLASRARFSYLPIRVCMVCTSRRRIVSELCIAALWCCFSSQKLTRN